MGRHYKLPFTIKIERKYNDINIYDFLSDWKESAKNRQDRVVNMDNALHIELKKFETYDIDFNQIIDLAIRYAFSKREFSKLSAQLIELKQETKTF